MVEQGYHTVDGVAHAAKRDLIKLKGLSEAKVDKIHKAACTIVPMGFTTASIVEQNRKDTIFVTTGSTELDSIMGGARTRTKQHLTRTAVPSLF
jgi:DNA repair protein RAD51